MAPSSRSTGSSAALLGTLAGCTSLCSAFVHGRAGNSKRAGRRFQQQLQQQQTLRFGALRVAPGTAQWDGIDSIAAIGRTAAVGVGLVAWTAAAQLRRRASLLGRRAEATPDMKEYREMLRVTEDATRLEIRTAFEKAKEAMRLEIRTAFEKAQKLEKARRSVSAAAQPMKYLFVGNPGTGKSTLLNSLIGEVVFKSGVSPGQGMTFKLDKHAEDGDTFMDTPGLADVDLREQAAKAITQALREGGHFKVIFVITLEAGRLRPADKSMMQLVLQSAPISSYGVIINKVSANLYDKVITNPDKEDPPPAEKLLAQLLTGLPPTKQIVANLSDPELEDTDQVLAPLTPALGNFLNALPPTYIETVDVKDIQSERFEELEQMFEDKLSLLAKNEAIAQELERSADTVSHLKRQLEQERMAPEERLRKQRADLEGQIKEQTKEVGEQRAKLRSLMTALAYCG